MSKASKSVGWRYPMNQRLRITQRISWVGVAVMGAWLIGELLEKHTTTAFLAALSLAGFLFTNVIIKLGYDIAARYLFLSTINIIVATGVVFFDPNIGSELPYIALAGLPWALLEDELIVARWLFALVPAALFVAARFNWVQSILHITPFATAAWTYWANALAAFLLTFVSVRLMNSESRRSEKYKVQRIASTDLIGVVIGRATGETFQMNDAMLKMLGFTREEFDAGKVNLVALTPPEYIGRTRQAFQEVREKGRSTPFEKEYYKKDGSRIPVLLGISSLGEPDPEDCIAFFLDLSAQRDLLASRRALSDWDDFSSIASHELKTPIAALTMQLDILQRALRGAFDDPNLVSTLASETYIATRRMNLTVDELLDFTRIRAGKLELTRSRVDLSEVCREAIGSLEAGRITQPGQCVLKTVGNSTGNWDRVRLIQVITNLLTNAVKYGKPPFEIGIDGGSVSGKVRLSVVDHGPGIPDEQRQRIFDKFERAESHVRGAKGLGLGLYIVRNIVDAHGATIRVENGPAGEGTSFIIELPVG